MKLIRETCAACSKPAEVIFQVHERRSNDDCYPECDTCLETLCLECLGEPDANGEAECSECYQTRKMRADAAAVSA